MRQLALIARQPPAHFPLRAEKLRVGGALYCTEGRPALPFGAWLGLLLLKSLRNLSEEEVVEFWSESAGLFKTLPVDGLCQAVKQTAQLELFFQIGKQKGCLSGVGRGGFD